MELEAEIGNFRTWAATVQHRSGEWEFYYPNWDKIYRAIENCLATEPLTTQRVKLLLYILARDNEGEIILDLLSENLQIGYQIAQQGLNYPDSDARWQIAVLLGQIGSSEAVILLRKMTNDVDEYVRRRALLAIRDIDKSFAEQVAITWLTSEHDSSRMVALDTLKVLGSDHLSEAMELLENDPSIVVKKRWQAIKGAE
jgi:HEAT repeat protein